MPDASIRLATAGDRPVLERLWLMFRHDMSEFSSALPNSAGTFRNERLEAAFTDAGWAPGRRPGLPADAWISLRAPAGQRHST